MPLLTIQFQGFGEFSEKYLLHFIQCQPICPYILIPICIFYYTTTVLQLSWFWYGFTGARDSEWQWHSWAMWKSAPRPRQITTPASHHWVFLQAGCPSCCPTNSVKANQKPAFWLNTVSSKLIECLIYARRYIFRPLKISIRTALHSNIHSISILRSSLLLHCMPQYAFSTSLLLTSKFVNWTKIHLL